MRCWKLDTERAASSARQSQHSSSKSAQEKIVAALREPEERCRRTRAPSEGLPPPRGRADLGRERSPGHVTHALTSICARRAARLPASALFFFLLSLFLALSAALRTVLSPQPAARLLSFLRGRFPFSIGHCDTGAFVSSRSQLVEECLMRCLPDVAGNGFFSRAHLISR